jgi:hypothetical protein
MQLNELREFIRETLQESVDVGTLMARTSALHLTALPKKGHQGQDEIIIVGSKYRGMVRSPLQWSRLLDTLEKRADAGDPPSHKGWGEEEDTMSGVMAPLHRVEGYND